MTGRHTSKPRQIPWKNVDCLSWIKLTTVHDEQNGIFNLLKPYLPLKNAHIFN
jgi:hypothetical protein